MKRPGIKKIIIRTLSFLLGTLAFTIVLYFVCSLFISTDLEKRLRAENRMYEEAFSHLWDHSEMLQDAIAGLQYKDNDIYGLVFHANAPQVDPMGSLDVYYASDTIPESRLASYTDSKADALLERTVAVAWRDWETLPLAARSFMNFIRDESPELLKTIPGVRQAEDGGYR